MILEQIKDEVAEDLFTEKWKELDLYQQGSCFDEIAKRYATSCVKASLEKASGNSRLIGNDYGTKEDGTIGWVSTSIKPPFILDDGNSFEVDKSSITNHDNIVLLKI